MVAGEIQGCEHELTKVRRTLDNPCGFTGFIQRRQKNRDQQRNDAYDYQ